MGLHLHGDLHRAHVAGFLNDFIHTQHAMWVRIGDRGRAHLQFTGRGLNQSFGLNNALLQSQTHHEWFHGGSWFKRVGEGAVS